MSEYGLTNPAPGTRLWHLRNYPETLTYEDAVQAARDLDRILTDLMSKSRPRRTRSKPGEYHRERNEAIRHMFRDGVDVDELCALYGLRRQRMNDILRRGGLTIEHDFVAYGKRARHAQLDAEEAA